ncbi:MAG: HAD family phosphatase [Candidatus Bilamarchaeaceae archaeon]
MVGERYAFLFDFDGVIADSEPLHLETFREILEPLGIRISRERWYREFVGVGSPQIMKILLGEIGITDEKKIASYVVERRELFQKRITEGRLQEKKGIGKFLKETKKLGIKTAVVSGGHRKNVALALKVLGLNKYFDVIIGREDYENKKPHPQCYLVGAKRLGMKIKNCIAFEDSISGCLSAQAAGIKVVAIEAPEDVEAHGCKPAMKIKDFEAVHPKDIIRLLSFRSL